MHHRATLAAVILASAGIAARTYFGAAAAQQPRPVNPQPQSTAQAPQIPGDVRVPPVPTPAYAVPRPPDAVKEGDLWVPDLPRTEWLLPPPGWQPSKEEAPWMPATLARLPRTKITRAKYPAIDFHLHAGPATPDLIKLLDRVGVGATVNLNGGTGAYFDSTLQAS